MVREVYAEINILGLAVRIFRSAKAAAASGVLYIHISRKDAVAQIREQVWFRAKSECEWCSRFIPPAMMHLHELKSRGEGGEISLSNCVGICYECHFSDFETAHGGRNPRFGEEG